MKKELERTKVQFVFCLGLTCLDIFIFLVLTSCSFAQAFFGTYI